MTIRYNNFTRYNTEDLGAIVEAAFEHARKVHSLATRQKVEDVNVTFRNGVELIEFHDFTPANPIEELKRWNGTTYDITRSRRYVGRTVWTRMERVPLLAPRLLYEPLEALAAASETSPTAPPAMVDTLFYSLLERFDYDRWNVSEADRRAPTAHLTLRINAKADTKLTNEAKERERLRLAAAQVETARYDLRDVTARLVRVQKCLATASNHVSWDGLPDARNKADMLLEEARWSLEAALTTILDGMKDRRRELGGVDEEV